jgi:hypothetical protein
MSGNTRDHTVTGFTTGIHYPLIAVSSVAIPDKYYWAKFLSLLG